MLDINFIRENPDKVKKAIVDKQLSVNLDAFLLLDEKRRALIVQIDEMRRSQNEFNKKVVNLTGAEKERFIVDMKVLSGDLKTKESEIAKIEKKYNEMSLMIPNIPSNDTPIGLDESGNVEIEKWGEPIKFDFNPKDHIALGKDLNIIDLEKGVRTSGFRGYYLKNEAASLHMAVLMYSFNKMREKGFEVMITPTILRDFALVGSGHFPFGKDDIYELANTGKEVSAAEAKETFYLGGTSEPSVLAYFADTVLDEADLPKMSCGFSQCYRNEVGSYGKDTKGLYRIHEFMKVEQVVLCKDDIRESDEWLEKLKVNSQEILKDLKLPHRVIQVCTGDMGAGKRKMYDIETWMPSRGNYGETHSDSNLTDWQSRRLNIKYKTKDGQKKYVYALNNTVIASPRILIAILENNQNEDGSITVPEVLRPLCGFEKIPSR
jgi:seryl-tRNA synthetase